MTEATKKAYVEQPPAYSKVGEEKSGQSKRYKNHILILTQQKLNMELNPVFHNLLEFLSRLSQVQQTKLSL